MRKKTIIKKLVFNIFPSPWIFSLKNDDFVSENFETKNVSENYKNKLSVPEILEKKMSFKNVHTCTC